jgi:hypothetical protein
VKDISIYNKIVKKKLLEIENIQNLDDSKLWYHMFMKAHSEAREYGRINVTAPSEMFPQMLISSTIYMKTQQHGVTHVDN